jgi:hypothetical protein
MAIAAVGKQQISRGDRKTPQIFRRLRPFREVMTNWSQVNSGSRRL